MEESGQPGRERGFPVIGVGASAGGVEALSTLFRSLPPQPGAAFIVVTHLSPSRESLLPEILGRCTRMPVQPATDGQPILKDHVYLNSPQSLLMVADGRFDLRERDSTHNPIDVFLASLAN